MTTPSPRTIRGGGRHRTAVIRTADGVPPVTLTTSSQNDPYMARVKAGVAYGRAKRSNESSSPTLSDDADTSDLKLFNDHVTRLEAYLKDSGHELSVESDDAEISEQIEGEIEPVVVQESEPVLTTEDLKPATPETRDSTATPTSTPPSENSTKNKQTPPQSLIPKPPSTKKPSDLAPRQKKPSDLGPRRKKKPDVDQVTIRLARDRREWHAANAQKKQDVEMEEVRQYSFKPEIHPCPADMHTRKGSNEAVSDRLFNDAEQRRETMAVIHTAVEEQDVYPFQPKVDGRGDRAPIHERWKEEKEAHERRMKDIRKKVEEERKKKEGATYQPDINPISRQIASAGRMHKRKKKQVEEPSFRPKISHKSAQMVSDRFGDTSFQQRQEEMAKKYANGRMKIVLESQRQTTKKQPQVGVVSQMIVDELRSGNDGKLGSISDPVERLGDIAPKLRRETQKRMEDDYYSQFGHGPKVNDVSRCIASSRLTESRGDGIDAVRKEMDREFAETHTFRPNMSVSAATTRELAENVTSIASPGRHARTIACRDSKIEARRREKEEKEMTGCTFRPELDPSIPKSLDDTSTLAGIEGLDGFLSQRIAAAKKEKENEETRARVFLTDVHVKPTRTRATKPKPFNLRGLARSQAYLERSHDVAEAVKAARSAECTFKPNTSESRRRERIATLLNE